MNKVLVSGMIGNGFEWYDFALYGQMAFILGHLFFPSDNIAAQSMATFAAFAVAFIFRPLGAIFFGWLGDKYGRKTSLLVAIIMMAIPTGLIGLMPTYQQIGIWAPILLIIIRILQGISLGGEFGGAITYIVEHSDGKKRGIMGCTTIAGLILGFIAGTVVVLAVKGSMSAVAFESWGWRLPFLLGIVIGVVGLVIRNQCGESPVYEAAKANGTLSKSPVRLAVFGHWREILQGLCAYTALTTPFYLVSIFFITYTTNYLGLTTSDSLQINMVSMGMMLLGAILASLVSDRIGRKRVMMPVLVLMSVVATFSLGNMLPGDFNGALFFQALLGAVVGLYIGPVPALLVEIFPTSVRFTGMSLAYNGATVLFGGTTPIICLALLTKFHTPYAIAAYFVFCCAVAFVGLCTYEDKSHLALA